MLTEADSSLTNMAMNNSRFQGDEYLKVEFSVQAKQNRTKSAEAGRPIFEDTLYIKIFQPGNKDSIIHRAATALDKKRFAEILKAYEARSTDEYIEGTLLESWPAITRAQCEELRYMNIRTVEQLANVSDSNAQGFMGFQTLKQKAKKFLETSEKTATAERFAELEAKYEALLAAQSEEKPKRGRPAKPKEEVESTED